MAIKPAVLLAGAAFVGVLGYGGISLASAQTSPSTVPDTTTPGQSTTPPNNSTPPNDSARPHDGNCPHMGSEGPGTSTPDGSTSLEVPNDVSNSV